MRVELRCDEDDVFEWSFIADEGWGDCSRGGDIKERIRWRSVVPRSARP